MDLDFGHLDPLPTEKKVKESRLAGQTVVFYIKKCFIQFAYSFDYLPQLSGV